MKSYDKNGYTLIELLVVSALLAVMLLMVSLKIGIGTTALKSEANSVVSALRYARQLNTNGELSQRFTIVAEKGRLYYCVQSKTSPVKTYLKIKFDKSIIIQKKMVADENYDSIINEAGYSKINKDINYIFFEASFTDNAANGDGTLLIESIDSKRLYKITIVPTSGRIYMYEIKR